MQKEVSMLKLKLVSLFNLALLCHIGTPSEAFAIGGQSRRIDPGPRTKKEARARKRVARKTQEKKPKTKKSLGRQTLMERAVSEQKARMLKLLDDVGGGIRSTPAQMSAATKPLGKYVQRGKALKLLKEFLSESDPEKDSNTKESLYRREAELYFVLAETFGIYPSKEGLIDAFPRLAKDQRFQNAMYANSGHGPVSKDAAAAINRNDIIKEVLVPLFAVEAARVELSETEFTKANGKLNELDNRLKDPSSDVTKTLESIHDIYKTSVKFLNQVYKPEGTESNHSTFRKAAPKLADDIRILKKKWKQYEGLDSVGQKSLVKDTRELLGELRSFESVYSGIKKEASKGTALFESNIGRVPESK